jgi:hypothetical protein
VSDKNSSSFGGRTVSNVAWLGGSQFLRQGISIGASLLIARLLALLTVLPPKELEFMSLTVSAPAQSARARGFGLIRLL